MSFLSNLGEKVAGLFKGIKAATDKVLNTGADIVTWEQRREALQVKKAAAYSKLLDLREKELEGRPDPDALAAAREQVTSLDEALDAASRKILTLHEQFTGAVAEETLLRHETAQERVAALEEERRQAYPAMAQLLAQAVALRDKYWKGSGVPFDFSRMSVPGFDQELAGLQSENVDQGFLAALQEAQEDVKRGPGTLANINHIESRKKTILKGLRS